MKSFIDIMKSGGVGVMKTDTLYGIVASAYNPTAVNRIYDIKKRDPLKPCIVLVSSFLDIIDMGFQIPDHVRSVCEQYWPGKVSIIIHAPDTLDTHYLHRGTGGVAFRVPDTSELTLLLKKTGPLVAPSANPEGSPPAMSIDEAMKYFGTLVDIYKDDGVCTNTVPSKLIYIKDNGDIQILRDQPTAPLS